MASDAQNLGPLSGFQLCEKCQVFKLSQERFTSSPFAENRAHQLGWFNEVSSRASCRLCKFISTALYSILKSHEDTSGARIHGSWNKISDGLPNACLCIWFTPRNEGVKIPFDIRLLQDDATSNPGAGRLLSEPFINPLMVINWLGRCERDHQCGKPASDQHRARDLPPGFMLIDVMELCLVEVPKPNSFLALSYVWGDSVKFKTISSNVAWLKQKKMLNKVWDQLSPVVKDAIIFTRELQERFIWIDSLCILQDNADSSQANISAMDVIYQQARLVITAADDRAIYQGLRGVTHPRTLYQNHAEILPGLKVLGTFSYSSYMDRSVYETRGWTFQEEQLGRRSLIFLNDQIYFSCRSHVFSEEVCEPNNSNPDGTLVFAHMSSRFIRDGIRPSILYFKAVEAFTARKLTYPLDTLNAFTGVGNVLDQQFGSQSFYGLPSCLFDLALLWQPVGAAKRKIGFPSWSWAGWDGSCRWIGDTLELASWGYGANADQEHRFVTTWLREHTWIDWKRLSDDGMVIPVWSTAGDLSTSDPKEHVGYDSDSVTNDNTYGRSLSRRDAIITDYSSRTNITQPGHCNITSLNLLISVPGALCFYTLTAKFQIQASEHYLRYGSIDPVWEPNGRTVFLLQNKFSQTCGYVLLSSDWKETYLPGESYDFLMLSEANYECQWGRPHENHPYKKSYSLEPSWSEFHVMMVEWKSSVMTNGGETFIAERAGIGRVLKEAVKDSCNPGPVWRSILLG